MQTDYVELRQEFLQHFGDGKASPITLVRAPGRVNLIGEHTDYNDGFVFPMAIEPEVRIAGRSRSDGLIRLASTAFAGQVVEFSIEKKIERGEPKWANYSRGVVAKLLKEGIPLRGMDALMSNTLPVGGGLSSSAAIEVGTARTLLALIGSTLDGDRLARLCQLAEHEFAGVPVGIMDQTIVATAREGNAMLLDCRSMHKEFVPLDPNDLRVVIVNSMVKHELSGGEYAERRHQCEEGVAFFKTQNPAITALRDVTPEQVRQAEAALPDVVLRRVRHVVGENQRTVEAAGLLKQRRYADAGKLMVQSHQSLRDDYEVSTPELDYLAEQAMTVRGVYGARMTGGGFGGCIVALTQPAAVEGLIAHLKKVYPPKFKHDPEIYVTTATAAAGVVS